MSIRYVELMVPHDAHAIAKEHGLLKSIDHPVARLCPTLQSACPVAGYGVDVGTEQGFEKIWTILGQPLTVDQAAAIDGVPDAIGRTSSYFGAHDLRLVSLFAIDYVRRSTNVYFMIKDPAAFLPDKVRGLIGDLDFEVPSDDILDHCAKARAVYYTFDWESPGVQRLCFGVIAPEPSAVPVELDPVIARYTGEAPSLAPQCPFIYSPTFARGGGYYKIENDYTGSMTMLMSQAAEMMP